jgi:hypothetical protein
MKRAFRFSIRSGRLSRDQLLQCFSFPVRRLPLGWLRSFAPRNDDSAPSEALAGGSNRGGIKAPSKPFSKLLQKSHVLLQAFPKKALGILWDFKGLQGFQTSFDAFQIFRLRPSLSAAFWTRRDHIPLPHAMALSASGGAPYFMIRFGRRRVHRGAAIQTERILKLTDNPIFGKKYP